MNTILRRRVFRLPAFQILAIILAAHGASAASPSELLNVSYDVARETYAQINTAFVKDVQAHGGGAVVVRQSHGGSSAQARAVAEGLSADVVTLNQVTDLDLLRSRGLIRPDWQQQFPNRASPDFSLPIFLVRAGNPKHIRDWSDLAKPGVQVVFPNPKTSGNGRYTYLAAYAWALDQSHGDAASATAFVTKLMANVPVFDTGGRGATTSFVERGIGDALVTFEAEIDSIRTQYGKTRLEAVYPSMSLRADFPVAIVDKVVDRKGTRKLAGEYLKFLYTPAGQEVLARNHNRVVDAQVAARHAGEFPAIRLVTVEQVFGSWDAVNRDHFAEGGILDQILAHAAAH